MTHDSTCQNCQAFSGPPPTRTLGGGGLDRPWKIRFFDKKNVDVEIWKSWGMKTKSISFRYVSTHISEIDQKPTWLGLGVRGVKGRGVTLRLVGLAQLVAALEGQRVDMLLKGRGTSSWPLTLAAQRGWCQASLIVVPSSNRRFSDDLCTQLNV